MTRKNFAKGLLTLLSPLPLVGATKQCYPVTSIWETPQGQYVKMLRKELERLDHWDDLEEDWQAVEDALKEGHLFFDIAPSRMEGKKLLHSIRPVFYVTHTYAGNNYLKKNLP